MTHDTSALRARVRELFDGAEACVRAERFLPALCLCFVAVDTMAWASRPRGEDPGRRHFTSWLDRYCALSSLGCTAADLYGSRCGLLHHQAPGSKLADEGKATKIWWAWAGAAAEEISAHYDPSGLRLTLQLGDVISALNAAGGSFLASLESDTELAQLVAERDRELFIAVP